MRRLYNILFTVFFVLTAPFYFLKMWRRGNWREGFSQRFGKQTAKTKQALTNRHVVWLHAVSVGEVNICMRLIRELEPRLPNVKFVVSTTTSTGMGELKKRLPSHIEKIYYPIDRKKFVERALWTVHPEAVILVEAEIWPNFLWRARDRKIPVFLVNARMSPKSVRRYKWASFIFRPIFASFRGVGVQNEADAARLVELGCKPEAVHVVGNLKFDGVKLAEKPGVDAKTLLGQLGVSDGAPVIVAGSTHAGEEAILAEIYLRLKPRFPGLFLIVVPRHHERGKEAGRDLQSKGVKFLYRREISAQTRCKPGSIDCLLVNTTGELRYFYECATVVFVGKSLSAAGGQSPIEPAALGKPVLFGPNMQTFAAIAASFVNLGGAIQVRDAAELEARTAEILGNPDKAAELGRNALKVVRENQGAIERTAMMISNNLRGEELFVAE